VQACSKARAAGEAQPVADRCERTAQDERSGNGGGPAYDSDADYGGSPRRDSGAASPAEPLRSTQASRVWERVCELCDSFAVSRTTSGVLGGDAASSGSVGLCSKGLHKRANDCADHQTTRTQCGWFAGGAGSSQVSALQGRTSARGQLKTLC